MLILKGPPPSEGRLFVGISPLTWQSLITSESATASGSYHTVPNATSAVTPPQNRKLVFMGVSSKSGCRPPLSVRSGQQRAYRGPDCIQIIEPPSSLSDFPD
jgi:hypothetical protein